MDRICPLCLSDNIAPAEQDYRTEYPFWIALIAVFFFVALFLVLFFFLQLHPVIMILLAIAAVSWLLDLKGTRKKKVKKTEFICLECEHRLYEDEK